ncbi:ABC transporter ATP-binding protein [Paenibacillus sp. GCM10023252]|uniref:ABC transporter ATP-binding protein n=1 Tax=Paenibacillus sp. GCM10023252 TaxID=3252649 RepID=UPI00360BAE2B
MKQQTVIEVREVSKSYGSNQAVDEVSLDVQQGEILGIIGTNGAGKSTLLEMMMGLRKPDSGHIDVLGLTVSEQSEQLKEHIGIYMQSTSLLDRLTVLEALQLFQSFYTRKRDLALIIEQFGLEPHLNRLVRRLSGGWQQRAALALAVVNDPAVLFLDEPTTGLDYQTRAEFWSQLAELKSQGKTIVLASHDMGEVQRKCDRVIVMRRGKVVACDTPPGLISQLPEMSHTMEAVYVHLAVEQGGSFVSTY